MPDEITGHQEAAEPTEVVAASAALCGMIVPQSLLSVTLWDLLVVCVTVPPAPVA